MKRNLAKISLCYENELATNPTLAGTVTATFKIDTTGRVISSSASGVDPQVDTCVAHAIEAIEFPKPRGGIDVSVTYPFTFRPAT